MLNQPAPVSSQISLSLVYSPLLPTTVQLTSCLVRLFNFWIWRMNLISKKLRFISVPQLVLVDNADSSRDLSFINLSNLFLKLYKLIMLLSHCILINSLGWLWTLWQMGVKMRNSWHNDLSKCGMSVLRGNGIFIFVHFSEIRGAGYVKHMGHACINPQQDKKLLHSVKFHIWTGLSKKEFLL